MFSYTITPNTMNIVIGTSIHTVDRSHVNYATIREAIKQYTKAVSGWEAAALIDRIKEMLDIKRFIAKFTEGAIQVSEDQVLFHGQRVHGVIADRLIAMVAEGFNPAPLARFLIKLQSNPTPSARDELYLWLETSNLPICDDGDFLAYKAVRDDYLSHHDGETDNSIGAVLKMKREDVDPDRDKTCSRGYHFCSFNYLRTYSTGRIVILKINPADVVSIPSDYSNQKGRAWTYQVVDEVERAAAETYLQGVSIAQADVGDVKPGGFEITFEESEPTIRDFVEVATGYTLTEEDRRFVHEHLLGEDKSGRRAAIRSVLNGDYSQLIYIFAWCESPQHAQFWQDQYEQRHLSQQGKAILTAYLAYYLELTTPVAESTVQWVAIDTAHEWPAETPAIASEGKYELTLSNGARNITLTELKDMLKEHGQRGTSRMTGIPRTTLQGWIEKFNLA